MDAVDVEVDDAVDKLSFKFRESEEFTEAKELADDPSPFEPFPFNETMFKLLE